MTTIKISDSLVEEAKRYAAVYNRSVPKQIEYWSRIGKIAEDNPDLPYDFIKDILMSLQEDRFVPYEFGTKMLKD